MWYQRLFGNTDHFAIQVELHRDPHPDPGIEPALAASWGRFALWVDGRCLTRSSRAGESADGVEWYLLPLLRWASEAAVALFNEEPFPLPTRQERIPAAVDWLEASEEPPWTQTEAEEEAWFLTRSDWRRRHVLRTGFDGAAVPQVVFRRLGDAIEVSWDNETWPSTRRDIQYLERVGVARVSVDDAEGVWLAFVENVSSQLAAAAAAPEVEMSAADGIPQGIVPPTSQSWRWLVPSNVSRWMEREPDMTPLVDRLRASAAKAQLAIPHTTETLLLRDCGSASDADLKHLARLRTRDGALSATLEALRDPRPASGHRPWLDGYDAALEVREALGWGDAPRPGEFAAWSVEHDVDLRVREHEGQIDAALVARGGCRPLIDVNLAGRQSRRWSADFMSAATLGVLLLDAPQDRDYAFVFGPRTHWPTAARARAFAAMLLMPRDGIRKRFDVGRCRSVDELAASVSSIMRDYGTSLIATTWHLNNLGFIDDEERVDLVSTLRPT